MRRATSMSIRKMQHVHIGRALSQLYAAERPPPIPPSEHERRRKVKDVQEVVDVSGAVRHWDAACSDADAIRGHAATR